LRERARLDRHAEDLRADGKFAEAAVVAEQRVAADRAALGPDHDEVADATEKLAALREAAGNSDAARRLREEVLRVRSKLHRESDWRIRDARYALTNGERIAGLDADARRRLGDAFAAAGQFQRLRRQGRYAAAADAARESLAIRRKVLGDDHIDSRDAANDLAIALQARAEFAEARRQYEWALAGFRKAVGDEHPRTAILVANIATLDRTSGNPTAARVAMENSLAFLTQARGPDHPDVATLSNNLGAVLLTLGEYPSARRAYERAFDIRKRVFGDESMEVALVLNNLSTVLQKQGDSTAGREFAEKALAVYRALGAEDHPGAAAARVNRAAAIRGTDDPAAARKPAEDALAAARKAHGDDHPITATAYHNLGLVLNDQKDHAAAREHVTKGLDIRRRVFGEDHPQTAASRMDLANVMLAQGQLRASVEEAIRGLEGYRNTLGDDHPQTAQAMVIVGFLWQFVGEYEAALLLLERGLAAKLRVGHDLVGAVSEAEALEYLARTDSGRDPVLAVLRRAKGASPEVAYRVVWDMRALVTRALLARRRSVEAVPEAQPIWEELQATRARLAQATLAEFTPDQADARRKELAELTARKERLERDLAAVSGGFRRQQAVGRSGPADLCARLPDGVAVVEFVRTNPFNVRFPTEQERRNMNLLDAMKLLHDAEHGNDPHYEAFVLTVAARPPGYAVARVDLGPAAPIERAVRGWRDAIEGDGTASERSGAAAVRQLVWDKVEPFLTGRHTVVVVPEGDLTRVPWAALPGKAADTFLVEERGVCTAVHGQHLYDLLTRDPPGRDAFLVVGGVRYDARPRGLVEAASSRAPALSPGPRQKWEFLPGTLLEAEAVAAAWKGKAPEVLIGAQADKAAVCARMPGARFVHLATHGYFADREFASAIRHDPARDVFAAGGAIGRNPLLLSGLALAGANPPAESTPATRSGGGILTGEEVVDLNLSGAELVVLSACDTARGGSAGGEGVYCLQRAFSLAGARATVATLWRVNDAAASLLMSEFYSNLWVKKLPKLEALRQAQVAVLRSPERVASQEKRLRGELASRGLGAKSEPLSAGGRSTGRTPPALWAAFVLAGDFR
jgi:CHAT domain-containing protein/tetratricopeptide (TPR) repeat protein